MTVSFFDTNVLVYIASADDEKADRAETEVAGGGSISVQVLNELANVARRKMRLSWRETRRLLDAFTGLLTVHPLTLDTHLLGLTLAERYSLSVNDGLIAASALDADCDTLWSEDMQHGLIVDGRLRILNPFRARPD